MARLICSLISLSLVSTLQPINAEDGFGSLSGRVVFEGKIPERKITARASGKDGLPPEDLLDESLIISEQNRGVANAYAWVKNVSRIHPKMLKPDDDSVDFRFAEGRVIPHAQITTTGRPVRIRNEHAAACNSHLHPIRNRAWNVLIAPRVRNVMTLPALKVPEVVPIRMQCDVHPWMQGWLLVLDHPYAAITKADGRFQINWLPEGDHELWVWHERTGFIAKRVPITVRDRKITRLDPFSFNRADIN